MLVNNGELKKVVDESIKLDHCIVDILNPDININLNDKLYNCTWCLFSINKFIEEQPELFNNKIVEKRIKYIALKQMSNNINSDIVSKTQIEDNVKYILERIK
jgi:hypothetical protein